MGQVERRQYFTVIQNSVLMAGLTPYELVVYAHLCKLADERAEAWPSHSYLAKVGKMSERQSIRSVALLVEKGFIQKRRRKNNSNFYVVGVPQEVTDSHIGSDSQSVPIVTDSHPTKNHIQRTTNKGYTPEFLEFWEIYMPIKSDDKGAAFKSWKARRTAGATKEALCIAARAYAKERTGKDKTYTKMAKTFLGPTDVWAEWFQRGQQQKAAEKYAKLREQDRQRQAETRHQEIKGASDDDKMAGAKVLQKFMKDMGYQEDEDGNNRQEGTRETVEASRQ
tara:strand:- start:847 stop:1686 length:840 start_codon:yes stop_codon:yes gene_type:complete